MCDSQIFLNGKIHVYMSEEAFIQVVSPGVNWLV